METSGGQKGWFDHLRVAGSAIGTVTGLIGAISTATGFIVNVGGPGEFLLQVGIMGLACYVGLIWATIIAGVVITAL